MHWKRLLTTLLTVCLMAYLAICIAMFFLQKRILFPIDVVAPVPKTWVPKGLKSEQALINSSCGKLHVAVWRTNQAKGTVMMFHGNGESLASMNDYVEAFHQLGYNLMSWDYPGYGQSTDCWFSQDMLLSDAESAYQWLAKQEQPEKIHLFGYSLGSGIALSVAAKHQQNPIYLVSGYDALLSIGKQRFSPYLPVRQLFRFPMQTEPWVDVIEQPIYLLHGLSDRVIPPQHAQALVDIARDKVHVEWVANAGHANQKLFTYRNDWLKRLLP